MNVTVGLRGLNQIYSLVGSGYFAMRLLGFRMLVNFMGA